MAAAGVFTGLQCFIDSIMYASNVFAGSPDLAIAIQSSLAGYALMQLFVTYFSGVRVLIAPVSYEVIPFLVSLSVIVRAAVPAAAVTPTMLAASCVVNGLAAVLLGLVSFLPITKELMAKLLPPVLQSGVMATVGWGIYTLAFDSLSVPGPNEAIAALTWTGGLQYGNGLALLQQGARLTLPAHALGVGLWLASRRTSHPALFPCFALLLTAMTHVVRVYTDTTLAQARADHWLMDEAEGQPFWTLWTKGLLSGGVRWDVLMRPDAMKELVSAVLFGPVINTVLNLVLVEPVIGESPDVPQELRAHAAGTLAAAVGGGYSNYLAVSNTAIHIKCGGKTKGSCYVGALVAALFFAVHPLFVVVGYVPTLLAAATCVYIGVDFLWDNLVSPAIDDAGSAVAIYIVFAIMLQFGMLNGVLGCAIAFQVWGASCRLLGLGPAAPEGWEPSGGKEGGFVRKGSQGKGLKAE
jgi:SulP family sulfate permease